MDNKYMKKFSTSLAIKINKMEIKTTLTFHLTTVRMAIIKNTNKTNVGEDMGEKEPSYSANGNGN
jgi:hypothetical protein